MTLIDLGDFKIRFDPKEVRINIDGDLIDVGARRNEEPPKLYSKDLAQQITNNDLRTALYISELNRQVNGVHIDKTKKKVKTL